MAEKSLAALRARRRAAARAERDADIARKIDYWSRVKGVAPDPDGEHIWILLAPPKAGGAKG